MNFVLTRIHFPKISLFIDQYFKKGKPTKLKHFWYYEYQIRYTKYVFINIKLYFYIKMQVFSTT